MRYAIPVLAQIGLCSFALAADTSLDEARTTWQSQLDKITAANSAALTALDDQVLAALIRAEDAARQAKDPSLAALTSEVERWKKEGGSTEESTVPSIAKIHQIYRSQKEAKIAERNKQIAAWFKSYDSRLAALKDVDAEAVKAEREKVSDSFLVREALVAAAEAKPSEPPKSPKAETTPAPLSNAPWQSLTKVKWSKAEGDSWDMGYLNSKDPFNFNGKEYTTHDFLFVHGSTILTYTFKRPITAFKALGCMDEGHDGNAFFVVTTDEGEVFRSKPITREHSEPIEITFKPTTTLIIKSDPNGGTQNDWTHLLEPKYR